MSDISILGNLTLSKKGLIPNFVDCDCFWLLAAISNKIKFKANLTGCYLK